MSGGKKGLPDVPKSARQTPVFRKGGPGQIQTDRAKRSPRDSGAAASMAAARVGSDHKRHHRPDRIQALRMVLAYKSALIPRRAPGVKPQARTLQVADLFEAGLRRARQAGEPITNKLRVRIWREAAAAVIPGFHEMTRYEQKALVDELRANAGRLLRRRRKRAKGKRAPDPIPDAQRGVTE